MTTFVVGPHIADIVGNTETSRNSGLHFRAPATSFIQVYKHKIIHLKYINLIIIYGINIRFT